MNKLTVITVLRSGPEWKPEFVYNFKKGLDKNLTRPFDFVCLSDINLNVDTVPLLDIGYGYWSKLQLFRPELNFTGPCLYFDLENYQRALSSRDVEKYVDGEADVVDYEKIINEFALLRNKWLGVLKALDQKQWQITNVVKLRVAGMEDATL
jgi:hypothetical protein